MLWRWRALFPSNLGKKIGLVSEAATRIWIYENATCMKVIYAAFNRRISMLLATAYRNPYCTSAFRDGRAIQRWQYVTAGSVNKVILSCNDISWTVLTVNYAVSESQFGYGEIFKCLHQHFPHLVIAALGCILLRVTIPSTPSLNNSQKPGGNESACTDTVCVDVRSHYQGRELVNCCLLIS